MKIKYQGAKEQDLREGGMPTEKNSLWNAFNVQKNQQSETWNCMLQKEKKKGKTPPEFWAIANTKNRQMNHPNYILTSEF